MAMAGVARRFAFFEVEFGVVVVVVTAGENPSSGETTNPHFVRGKNPKVFGRSQAGQET